MRRIIRLVNQVGLVFGGFALLLVGVAAAGVAAWGDLAALEGRRPEAAAPAGRPLVDLGSDRLLEGAAET